jgi:hypothetical protein
MPSVLRTQGYRFFFYSLEGTEPPHIHVERGDDVAKFWLHELNRVRLLVTEYRLELLEAWNAYFSR